MLTTSFVEIDSHPIGIVWHEQVGYRFIAASQRLKPIDDMLFSSLQAATEAAVALLCTNGGEADLYRPQEAP